MTEGSDHPQYDRHLGNMAELEAYRAIGTVKAIIKVVSLATEAVNWMDLEDSQMLRNALDTLNGEGKFKDIPFED